MAVRLFDFLSGLSAALDLMSPEVVGHHKRVAYIAIRLAKALGLSQEELTDLFMAAILHDVGGFTLQSRLAALSFEADGTRHAELGYRLMLTNPLLDSAAIIVRHHHTPRVRFDTLEEPPRKLYLAGLLNLADRVDVLTIRLNVFDPVSIIDWIRPRAGYQFDAAAVEALSELARDPKFWAPLNTPDPTLALINETETFQRIGMSRGQLIQASTAFSQIIDFRSRFTATHSRGVAETAVCLAEKVGLCAADLTDMRLAGNLHDLGKLAVPAEIINKPGPLTVDEMSVMHSHPGLSESILSSVPGFQNIAAWASQHHEQLSGAGYPHGLKAVDIPLGSRVMTVADVFTALREDRPYRAGMSNGQTMRILKEMSSNLALDLDIVSLVHKHQDEIDERRHIAQNQAALEFRQFYSGVPAQ